MMMQITINHTQVEVLTGETLIETARRAGSDIPSLCYAKGAVHKASCMVCAVKDCRSGQIIPSCSTYPVDGMQVDTDSEEVRTIRRLSLELLISDHRADCEAPCSMVCTHGLDIERMLALYDAGCYEDACGLLAATFASPADGCRDCKAPCEKVCRRGTVDTGVRIRAIISELAAMHPSSGVSADAPKRAKPSGELFYSRLGRFTAGERDFLKESTTSPSRCLHCACAGRDVCQLRVHASAAGIKRSRYDASSARMAMKKNHIAGALWFEPAKCICCGLCVYNSDNGFTFQDRGFGMQVVMPDDNRMNVREDLAALCPVGALYIAAPLGDK